MRRRFQFSLKTLFWVTLVVSAFCAGRSIQTGYLRRQLLQSQDKLYYSERQYVRHTKALKAHVALLEDRLSEFEAKR
jgi:hypothetical protein